MCYFFSCLSNGKGKVHYFGIEDTLRVIFDGNPRSLDFNSHTSIAFYYNLDEDKYNQWEYDPKLEDLIEVHRGIGAKDDRTKVLKFLKSLSLENDYNLLEQLYDCDFGKRSNKLIQTGFNNIGNYNSGHHNIGDNNSGDYNIGDNNLSGLNIGNNNLGFENIGNFNVGDYNIGNHNKGSRLQGNCNTGRGSIHYFCSFPDNEKIIIFNQTVINTKNEQFIRKCITQIRELIELLKEKDFNTIRFFLRGGDFTKIMKKLTNFTAYDNNIVKLTLNFDPKEYLKNPKEYLKNWSE
mgnify:FL=1